MVLETIAGGLMGGLFRLAPEVLKFFDRDNERKHELAMFDKQLEMERLTIDSKVAIAQERTYGQGLEALTEALKGEGKRTGIAWVDALSASVRPVIAYWFMLLYAAVKTTLIVMAVQEDGWVQAMALAWQEEDMAIFSSIISFWYLSRVFDRRDMHSGYAK